MRWNLNAVIKKGQSRKDSFSSVKGVGVHILRDYCLWFYHEEKFFVEGRLYLPEDDFQRDFNVAGNRECCSKTSLKREGILMKWEGRNKQFLP